MQSNGNSDGNSNGNSDGNAKEDAPPSGNEDGLPNEESYSGEGQTNPNAANSGVAKIGNTEYATLHARTPQAAKLPLRCKAI